MRRNDMAKEGIPAPVKIYKCPNCYYLEHCSEFNIIESEKYRTIICPQCGIHFSGNIRYIREEILKRLRDHKLTKFEDECNE
jgi:transcription elongation factor Elf1